MRWDTGIALAAHRKERTVEDLLQANVRWVNREEGSAARRTFDALLGRSASRKGYANIVRDHRAGGRHGVERLGRGRRLCPAGRRRSAPGLHSAAAGGLRAVRADALLDDPRIAALRAILRSVLYRRHRRSAGVRLAETGDQRAVA